MTKKNKVINKKNVKRAAKTAVGVAKALGVRKPGARVGAVLDQRFHLPGVGSKVGSFLDKITGLGEYRVSSNSLATASMRGVDVIPSFKPSSRGTLISHREYIGDITSTTSFTVKSYRVNPGAPTTFPWLSTIAGSWDKYRPKGCVFGFKSTSAEWNGTTQALGTIIMASDSDAKDPTYATKQEMEQAEGAVSCKASESLLCPIECAPRDRPTNVLYISGTSSFPVGTDQRLYDLATFQIATSGFATAGVTVGELWVTYEWELITPQVDLNSPFMNVYIGSSSSGTTVNLFNGMTPFNNGNYNTFTPIFGTQTVALGNATSHLPAGYYALTLQLTKTSGLGNADLLSALAPAITNGGFVSTMFPSGVPGSTTTIITGATDTIATAVIWFKAIGDVTNPTVLTFSNPGLNSPYTTVNMRLETVAGYGQP